MELAYACSGSMLSVLLVLLAKQLLRKPTRLSSKPQPIRRNDVFILAQNWNPVASGDCQVSLWETSLT